MNGREKQEMTSLSQKHFEIQGHALSFYFFSSISSPSTFHIVGLNDYWWKLKAIREIGIIICDDPSKATVGSISLLSACSSHFISFVTWIPFRQALPSALPLASATACYSTCQKLLSLNLTLPSPFLLHITLDSYVFFFSSSISHILPGRVQPQQQFQIHSRLANTHLQLSLCAEIQNCRLYSCQCNL